MSDRRSLKPVLIIDLVSPEKPRPQLIFPKLLPVPTTNTRSRTASESSAASNRPELTSTDQVKLPLTPQPPRRADGVRVARCPICLECVFQEQAASTPCGHLFCRQCITQEVQVRPKCPMCSRVMTAAQITTIYGIH